VALKLGRADIILNQFRNLGWRASRAAPAGASIKYAIIATR
jgi:hypothetical protein